MSNVFTEAERQKTENNKNSAKIDYEKVKKNKS